MARERRVDRDFGRLAVADFADHDDVGVLTQERAESPRERHADLRLHLHLVDAGHVVFYRVLGRHDADVDLVDFRKERVERRRLAGASGSRHEEDAVRSVDDLADDRVVALVEAEVVHLDEVAALREKSERDRLTVRGRHGRDTDVDVLASDANADTAVHREALLGDIEVRHDLDTRDDRALEAVQLGRNVDLVEHAVDAVADSKLRLLRLDVDIGRALAVCFGDDLVYELDDRRLFAHLVDVDLRHCADVFVDGIAAVLDHLLDRVRAYAVVFLYGILDFFLRGERGLYRAARDEPEAVRRGGIERVGGDDCKRSAVGLEREDVVLVDCRRGEFSKRVRVRLLAL